MKIKLFTHTDLDGVGCSVLALLAFGKENVDVTYCNYNDVNQVVEKYINSDECNKFNITFITDISVNGEVADRIDVCNRKKLDSTPGTHGYVYLIDHHPTALNLNKYSWCNVKIENMFTHVKTSGTELFYKALVDTGRINGNHINAKRFVELITDYDTWRWTTLGKDGLICKQVNDLYYIYDKDYFIDWCITQITNNTFPTLNNEDKIILDVKQKEIDSYVKEKDRQMVTYEILGRNCGVVFADKYVSELGDRLCEMNRGIDFVVLIDIGNKKVSYRTIRNDIDLGKDIAALFGGGGHKMAAGSPLDNVTVLNIIDEVFRGTVNKSL